MTPGLADALDGVLSFVGRYRRFYLGAKIVITEGGTWTQKGFRKDRGRHYEERFRFGPRGGVLIWERSQS
jgi:hypothetical protein